MLLSPADGECGLNNSGGENACSVLMYAVDACMDNAWLKVVASGHMLIGAVLFFDGDFGAQVSRDML